MKQPEPTVPKFKRTTFTGNQPSKLKSKLPALQQQDQIFRYEQEHFKMNENISYAFFRLQGNFSHLSLTEGVKTHTDKHALKNRCVKRERRSRRTTCMARFLQLSIIVRKFKVSPQEFFVKLYVQRTN